MTRDLFPETRLSRRRLLQQAAALTGAVALNEVDGHAETSASDQRAAKPEDLVGLVNCLQGTNSDFGFSRGNTLPLVCRPFGMTHWSPQTRPGDGWFFDPNALSFQGMRATHQPSPWIGDYGNFTILAQAGEPVFEPAARASKYLASDLQAQPNYFSLLLQRDIVRLEMTPTDRCALFRFTFPGNAKGRVLLDALSQAEIDPSRQVLSGLTRHNSGGAPSNFACYFYARFDRPFTDAYRLHEHKKAEGQTAAETIDGVAAEFESGGPVVLRIATSFISVEQAKRTLEQEIGSRSFDTVKAEGSAVWNQALGVVRIAGATEEQRRTFYSCLYRTNLFPRMFYEFDASGKPIHYSPYDGTVHPGVLYTDTGLWDGYRTLYPLLSLLQPARLGEMIQGFVNAYHEGGWLPQWPSPGTRGGMGGTHSDAVITDALLKDIRGFDREAAYAANLKNATVIPGPGVFEGRPHLREYLEKGYAPGSVSNSLDFAYNDACIALAARSLGKTADYEMLKKRAGNYRTLYNPATGFMQARDANGDWKAGFDEYAWGGPYTEGGAWQWTWAVPHDPAGLIALMGGQKVFLSKLDRMLLQPSTFHVGGYGQVIHEMKEMAAVPFGQYDQGNQPTHHVLFLFAAAGCPWKTQYWSRRVLDQLYSPDNFAGDEDNGEMAAWYIFSALGFYPLCTGSPSYVIGSPLFREVWVSLPNRKTLHLAAPENAPNRVYVDQVTLNGKRHSPLFFSHAELARGADVRFQMAAFPANRAVTVEDLPFSFTDYDAAAFDSKLYQTEIRIHCGGDAFEEFVGDCFFEGGTAVKIGAADAPGIHRTARSGPCRYRIPLPMLPENRSYRLRLQFADRESAQAGFTVNGRVSKSKHEEIVQDVGSVRPEQDGAIVLQFPEAGEGKGICKIEIVSN